MQQPTPVPSRAALNPAMAVRGLKPAQALAEGKPCGTRVRYYAGCRCPACKRANSQYETERARARAAGDHRGLVDAAPVVAHINALRAQGLGWKTIADSACVSTGTVSDLIYGKQLKLRGHTARKLLAVTALAARDGAYIDARPSWALIKQLLRWGYPRSRIASEMLGRPVRALQLQPTKITVRNAELVRRVHERLRREPARATLKLLAELHEEGFTRARMAQLLADTAAAMGEPAPDLEARDGTLLSSTARVVARLHARLLMDQ